ncbi:MAG: c-type cytochrome biogenesis protein CcsB [bacterium]|jgi:cytochrome c-type biogenesis protein CcsB
MSQAMFVQTSWIVYLLSTLVYSINTGFVRSEKAQRAVGAMAYSLLVLGFASHTCYQILRAVDYYHQYRAFNIPAASLFEAINFFAWWVALIYIIAEPLARTRLFGAFVVAIPTVAIVYSMMNEGVRAGMDQPRQLVAALKSPWLNIHVTAMFISYAAFMLSAAFAIYFILRSKFGWGAKAIDSKFSLDDIDTLIYRFVVYGYPFLTFGVFAGAVWADQAWGVYWAWDPKETWALITWLIYTAFLHTRLAWGWKGNKTAMFALVGFLSVLITFLGVNFLVSYFQLESVHAYI